MKKPSFDLRMELNVLLFAFLLHFAWEVLQTPFFVDINFDINTIIWFRLHCTMGDMIITLGCFWLVVLVFKDRLWIMHPQKKNIILFSAIGVAYTIFSEIKNVTIRDLWGYSDLMPVIPYIGVGVVPVVQWIAIPPLIIYFVKRQLS